MQIDYWAFKTFVLAIIINHQDGKVYLNIRKLFLHLSTFVIITKRWYKLITKSFKAKCRLVALFLAFSSFSRFFQTFATRCCILKWLFKLNFFPSISILYSAFSEFFFNYDVISYTKNGLENKASHRGDRMIVSFRCCRLLGLMKTRLHG